MEKRLRDYQEAAAQAVQREFQTNGSTLVVVPTGGGKTLIAAELIRRHLSSDAGGGCIFLAHRKELLAQAKSVIETHAGARCELELGNQKASEAYPADVVLASVQSMIAGRNGTRRMQKFSPFSYSLLICDEGHHFTAPMFRETVSYFKSGNPDIKIVYFTATPNRTDEKALGQICETVAYDYPILQAIKDGWLVPIKQQLIDIQGLDFSHIKTVAGDLALGELGAVMEAERNLYGICDATVKEIAARKGIMFCVTVRQAQAACEILNRYRSGMATWASGKTPPVERDRIIRDYRENRHQLFVNVDLVSEGADFPDAEILIGARPTKSPLWYQQSLGRIMRPLPGVVDGLLTPTTRLAAIADSKKPTATVMDFAGNAGKHKLIHAIDVLGGKMSEKTRALVERKLREGGQPERVDELVLEAERKERHEREAQEAARKARLTGRATYTMRTIDPFNAFDLIAPGQREWYRGKVLSEKQRNLLRKQGVDPDSMSYEEAKLILNEQFRRWKNNLSTLRQSACLKKFGYETRNMTFQEATDLITKLKANNWQKV